MGFTYRRTFVPRNDNRALKFGIVTVVTDSSIPTVELARWAEHRGFESLFMGEHSHIPTSRRTPYPGGEALPEYYKHFPDPFVEDRKSTRLNSSHLGISYAVF